MKEKPYIFFFHLAYVSSLVTQCFPTVIFLYSGKGAYLKKSFSKMEVILKAPSKETLGS